MSETKIEWTDRTWNPTRGCTRVSKGCEHCYAERVAHRFSGHGQPYEGLTGPEGRWNGRIRLARDRVRDPLRWRKPSLVFVDSMSDLFHEQVPDDYIDEVFAVMALARRHTFQVLTKRPLRMLEYCSRQEWAKWSDHSWPLPNVWLGVSAEDQETADARIPLLLETPTAVRFVSAEPLLGPIDLCSLPIVPGDDVAMRDALRSEGISPPEKATRLDWVIVGGESGPRARPCHVDWIRFIVKQCRAASVPCFVKQLGADCWIPHDEPIAAASFANIEVLPPSHGHDRLVMKEPKGGDPNEWPEDLRVRDMPAVLAEGC